MAQASPTSGGHDREAQAVALIALGWPGGPDAHGLPHPGPEALAAAAADLERAIATRDRDLAAARAECAWGRVDRLDHEARELAARLRRVQDAAAATARLPDGRALTGGSTVSYDLAEEDRRAAETHARMLAECGSEENYDRAFRAQVRAMREQAARRRWAVTVRLRRGAVRAVRAVTVARGAGRRERHVARSTSSPDPGDPDPPPPPPRRLARARRPSAAAVASAGAAA